MSVASGNTFYVTVTSSSTVSTYVRDKDLQIVQVILSPNAANDYVDISDMDPNSVAAGSMKVRVKAEANGTKVVDLSESPIRCANGIWIANLSASAVCTIVYNKRG